MNITQFLRKGKIIVNPDKYAYIKTKQIVNEAFVIIKDGLEYTIVVNQNLKIENEIILKKESNLRILFFDIKFQFDLVGVISEISTKLANEGISLFLISSYSTDYIIIKDEDLQKTVEVFNKMGIEVVGY